jgi:hypothetical protein
MKDPFQKSQKNQSGQVAGKHDLIKKILELSVRTQKASSYQSGKQGLTSFKSNRPLESLSKKYVSSLENDLNQIGVLCREFLDKKDNLKPKKRNKQNQEEKLRTSIDMEDP